MSKSLDPDQALHFVGPDLVQTVCKSYQQMTLGVELMVKNAFIEDRIRCLTLLVWEELLPNSSDTSPKLEKVGKSLLHDGTTHC